MQEPRLLKEEVEDGKGDVDQREVRDGEECVEEGGGVTRDAG